MNDHERPSDGTKTPRRRWMIVALALLVVVAVPAAASAGSISGGSSAEVELTPDSGASVCSSAWGTYLPSTVGLCAP